MSNYNKAPQFSVARSARETIGREVHFVKGVTGNNRNGEAAHVRLRNGDILCAYSQFLSGDDWSDHAASRIAGFLSHDEGETWSEAFPLIELSEGQASLMCASLLRLADGDIALLYGAYLEGNRAFQMYFRRSADEGKTWGEAVPLLREEDLYAACYCLENDRLIELSSGRLLTAAGFLPAEAIGKNQCTGITALYSDDGGATWVNTHADLWLPFPSTFGLQEPGIIALPDGRLRMWARTHLGCQYESYSSDEGLTWSAPAPMEFFKSPLSPMLMKHAGDMTVAVYNPEPTHYLTQKPEEYVKKNVDFFYDRTPLALAVSTDGGLTFARPFLLEEDPLSIYCYPAIFDGGDYILVSYYHSNRTDNFFQSYKTVKIEKAALKA